MRGPIPNPLIESRMTGAPGVNGGPYAGATNAEALRDQAEKGGARAKLKSTPSAVG